MIRFTIAAKVFRLKLRPMVYCHLDKTRKFHGMHDCQAAQSVCLYEGARNYSCSCTSGFVGDGIHECEPRSCGAVLPMDAPSNGSLGGCAATYSSTTQNKTAAHGTHCDMLCDAGFKRHGEASICLYGTWKHDVLCIHPSHASCVLPTTAWLNGGHVSLKQDAEGCGEGNATMRNGAACALRCARGYDHAAPVGSAVSTKCYDGQWLPPSSVCVQRGEAHICTSMERAAVAQATTNSKCREALELIQQGFESYIAPGTLCQCLNLRPGPRSQLPVCRLQSNPNALDIRFLAEECNSECTASSTAYNISLCSGRGVCFEGRCQCSDRVRGRYCELFPCPISRLSRSTVECAGHGSCSHSSGRCTCDLGWRGSACDERVECGRSIQRLDEHARAMCGGDNSMGNICTAACMLGYGSSHASFSCGADGLWKSPSIPLVCPAEEMCSDAFGQVEMTAPGCNTTASRSSCQYVCAPSWRHPSAGGSAMQSAVCLDGVWVPHSPHCQPMCPVSASGIMCTGRGKCNSLAVPPSCQCDPGWEGQSCDRLRQARPCTETKTSTYCAGDVGLVQKELGDTTNPQLCEAQVQADSDCGEVFYHSLSRSECRCVLQGQTCQARWFPPRLVFGWEVAVYIRKIIKDIFNISFGCNLCNCLRC